MYFFLSIDYPRKGKVDNAILSLQENGELSKLKTKWWEKEDNDAKCEVWKCSKINFNILIIYFLYL